jgi:hypothetical protein
VLFILLSTHGCSVYRLTIPDSHPADINYRVRTMHSLAWGAFYKPELLAAECGREAINDVRIRRTLFHDLAAAATLGVWIPLQIEFRCASTRPQEGPPLGPK